MRDSLPGSEEIKGWIFISHLPRGPGRYGLACVSETGLIIQKFAGRAWGGGGGSGEAGGEGEQALMWLASLCRANVIIWGRSNISLTM